MFRVGTISMVSVILIVSSVFAQQTISVGDFDFTLGGCVRALYTSEKYRDSQFNEIMNHQNVFLEVARLNLAGEYGDHLSAYIEGGYFKDWRYSLGYDDYERSYDNWFYLGWLKMSYGMFELTGGLDFVNCGIEPSIRDVDLHLLRPSLATLRLAPMRKPGVRFSISPFRSGEHRFMTLSFGLYDDIYPPFTSEYDRLEGDDRRFFIDLPYVASLALSPFEQLKITGYYGNDTNWIKYGYGNDEWDEDDDAVLRIHGAGLWFGVSGFGVSVDYFYKHAIERYWYWGTYASNGGQLSVYYEAPPLGPITFEPVFRIDILNPQKGFKYDKITTYAFGLNLHTFDEHISLMMNYYHPREEVPEGESQYPNDEFYTGLQLIM
ncbi:MAG: hypothetical protein B6D57_03660 [Candidatus Coatesbacteria bacterium 4484_99]|uniref:Porin domain-containing protein n=1 Tax=Candidatus Coatesbacteria bacterium 4484_99 TaxID=1970774 RepID=A0A1W9S0G3_9BACT|nr:MAG: hypothetical protein B6D57_03660 [Candidatus Coatesbacteria bacterium 4484_99]RLC40279.1 MAG: hypothetical protein DRH51_05830 [Candidatus Coatesbacteria bacterium]RLC40966.1 MAG: hypothetical protein DRH44_07925 [Candidatus Coatesbacteria bacterium]